MITMISYFNRNNRHAYHRSMFIFSTRFSISKLNIDQFGLKNLQAVRL